MRHAQLRGPQPRVPMAKKVPALRPCCKGRTQPNTVRDHKGCSAVSDGKVTASAGAWGAPGAAPAVAAAGATEVAAKVAREAHASKSLSAVAPLIRAFLVEKRHLRCMCEDVRSTIAALAARPLQHHMSRPLPRPFQRPMPHHLPHPMRRPMPRPL